MTSRGAYSSVPDDVMLACWQRPWRCRSRPDKNPGAGAQDVGRLDIPVQHAVLVADPQGVADIQRDLLGQGGGLVGCRPGERAQLVQRSQAVHADQNVQRRVIGFLDSGSR